MKGFRGIFRAAAFLSALSALFSCNSLFDAAPSPAPAEAERQLFDAANARRIGSGLAALVWSDLIAAEARAHSKDMADGTVPFGHDGFSDRFARISLAIPADAGAENIAYGPDADAIFRVWMDSAGHKANILGDYDFTGVGAVWDSKSSSLYSTQIFIRSR
jgi:uncharacterized protein YkwD